MSQRGVAGFAIVVFIIVLMFAVLVYVLVVSERINKNTLLYSQSSQPSSISASKTAEAYQNFFLSSIPKPIENISIYQLPNDKSPRNIIQYKDSFWFSGDGSIIEYDTKNEKILNYSDMTKANCEGEVVLLKSYIYTTCHIDNIDDAFGTTHTLNTPFFTGHSGVLKINPDTRTVEKVFSKEEGLLNGYNLHLYPDEDSVWVATFQGVGRILANDTVEFYDDELSIPGGQEETNYGVDRLFVDKDYVWVAVGSNVGSVGGLALFDKKTKSWTSFTARELKDSDQTNFDLETSVKSIPGGVQLGFRDGYIKNHDKFVEKQYNYNSKIWTKINERPLTGEYADGARKYIESNYPFDNLSYVVFDNADLSQIKLPGSEKIYVLDGRNNYTLSPVINGKRYILTNATIDYIDNSTPFRNILVKLNTELLGYMTASADYLSSLVQLLIDPDASYAVITESDCGGRGCEGKQRVIFVDLKQKKVNKIYQGESDGVPSAELFHDLTMEKVEKELIIKGKDGKPIFSINLNTFDLNNLAGQ